jgi:nucleotide-binding universal stress UspA family protein
MARKKILSRNRRSEVASFKHILIPTDGSRIATRAAAVGLKLAQSLGASVTAYCSVTPLRQEFYGKPYESDIFVERLRNAARKTGMRYVSTIERMAQKAGVTFYSRIDGIEPTYMGIIVAARKSKCDLILIGSQGRSGLSKMLLGSVAAKVIEQSTIPVLVCRAKRSR